MHSSPTDVFMDPWDRILVQVTIYRRLRIGRDGHLDQCEAYDICCQMLTWRFFSFEIHFPMWVIRVQETQNAKMQPSRNF